MIELSLLFAALSVSDDRDLVQRLKQRDQKAMGDLYDRFGRLAYTVILRMVRNQAVAEDLCQETFLRVWNRVQAFDHEKGALGPWVLAIARNRAIDHLRSVAGRMSQNVFELDAHEHPSLFVNMEADVLNMERARHLKAAFEKLNSNQKLVLELAYFEGLSQSEMAEKLKQPLGTVKTWTRSALRALRAELGQAVAV
ncbi:MAG TPA: sigma-70 family RNA polymerase sigma factor [Bryobacteraceae bacterium]|jgi:RNA polymerase sigma-70 factor (ECF subfamily)|nr:sigma-70 family RNA polymerase sigma factor [Bryobacteraceae bacterium]